MTSLSPLSNVLKKGLFGNFEGKNEDSLIKIREVKNLIVFQFVQYKNSSLQIKNVLLDGLNISKETLSVNSNSESRILWCGPKNWLFISTKKNLLESIKKNLNQSDFAITDLSHSRSIIEIQGEKSLEVLKKGCPFNLNELKKNNSVNTIFNGIAITLDIIEENPYIIRIFGLRSFGETLYHSITDASLEFGYKVI